MSGLYVINGSLEVLGQHNVNLKDINQKNRFVRYAYIRFLTNDGQTIMLEDVDVVNILDSYLSPGIKGRFIFFDPGKGIPLLLNRYKAICALKIDGKIVDGYSALESELNKARTLGIILMVISIPALCFLVGIPLLIAGIMLVSSKIPSPEEIRTALEKQ